MCHLLCTRHCVRPWGDGSGSRKLNAFLCGIYALVCVVPSHVSLRDNIQLLQCTFCASSKEELIPTFVPPGQSAAQHLADTHSVSSYSVGEDICRG